tara:strand:- start:5668 stop:6627 length:960 start_codon:yes stop_codon:yes gene_type:complete
MNIIVTGAAGFIGYHTTKKLLEGGFNVLGVDNYNEYYDKNLKLHRVKLLESYDNFLFEEADLSNLDSFSKAFINFNPKKVVHLAAQPGVRYSFKNPNAYTSSNLVAFTNIIEISRKNNVENFVYASSSSVYGGNKTIPFSENHSVDLPISLYGATKRANELIAYTYSHIYQLNTTGLRFFTVYGPWYRPDMGLFLFTKNIFSGEPIEVFNNGNMQRDFTFIDDITDGILLSLNQNNRYEIFNLGNSKSENLMDVIRIIENEARKKAKVKFKPIQKGDLIKTCADLTHSRKMLGFEPKISIEIGIPKLVNWYKEYYSVKP